MCDKAYEYFKRSFFAVDGLWFMKLEEEFSFDKVLEIDEKVWKVMPKIQSKKLRELYGINGNSIQDLLSALKIKLEIEGYKVSIEKSEEDYFEILIHECPWFNIMKRSGREALAGKVGEVICNIEYQGWADSFDKNIRFALDSQLCKGGKVCRLEFQRLSSRG
ncbi:MAG: L-2-amino-thiazoline-4-carboxylic acid hydrolase [archaeon]|nr:L-2-amino-thiazoline-4-carboxylic acid hydrolase [archaeon]MCP8320791.1 L-2-amino-thiazoline-4-carboxylic acid hydrolase [archaeon]